MIFGIFKKPAKALTHLFTKVNNARYSLAKKVNAEAFEQLYPERAARMKGYGTYTEHRIGPGCDRT
jgi:hypothetical protein